MKLLKFILLSITFLLIAFSCDASVINEKDTIPNSYTSKCEKCLDFVSKLSFGNIDTLLIYYQSQIVEKDSLIHKLESEKDRSRTKPEPLNQTHIIVRLQAERQEAKEEKAVLKDRIKNRNKIIIGLSVIVTSLSLIIL